MQELLRQLKVLADSWQAVIDANPGGLSWASEEENMQPCVDELRELIHEWERKNDDDTIDRY